MIPNVIVFGETGVGKSSVVNLILGNDEARTSINAEGCTFDNTVYPVPIEGKKYNLYDTSGLNEAVAGTVDGAKALANLYGLVRSLSEGGGINLLVFVVKCGRLTETMKKNYDVFHHAFCEGKAPIIIVITGCENVEPMDSWWDDNKERFERSDMVFNGHACVSAYRGRKIMEGIFSNGQPFEESKGKVEQLIREHCLLDGWKKPLIPWFKSIFIFLATLLNFWSNIPALYKALYERLLRFLSPYEADAIIDAIKKEE